MTDEPDTSGGRHSRRARRQRPDDGDAYPQPPEGKRRWPVVPTLLVVLALFIVGGLYGGWRYIQGQYYIGVQDGNVAIFRGVNQNLAGISLSSLVQRYSLPVAQVVPSDQSMIRQTITESNLTGAQSLVGQIQSGVSTCRQKWQALVSWQAAEQNYQRAVSLFREKKTRTPPTNNPGAQPATPDVSECAPASAFGIPANALPGSQPVTAPTTAPSTRSTTSPSPTSTKAAG